MDSSLGSDTNTRVAVGEVLTYEVAVTLPEGNIEGLVIRDEDLDADEVLTLLAGEVVSIGGNSASGARQGGNLAAPGGGDLPAGVAVGSSASAAGNTVTFDFGDVTNTADGAEDAQDQIVVRVRGVVANDGSNTAGDTLTNTATVAFGPGGSRLERTATEEVTLLGPSLTFTHNATAVSGAGSVESGNVLGADAGDVITYQLVVNHDGTAAGNSDTPAYNLDLTDTLPTAPGTTFNDDASFSADCQTPTSGADGTTAGTVDVSVARLEPGDTCTVTYTVTVDADAAPSTTDETTVSLGYASTPGGVDETPRAYTEADQTSSVSTAAPTLAKTIDTTSFRGRQRHRRCGG